MKRRQALRERTLSRNSQAPKQGFYFGAGEAITGINNDRGFSSSLMPGKAPMPWKTPGGLGGRAPQSQNHLPFPKKRIFRLANRKLVESQALSPRSQLQDVTKNLRNGSAIVSHVSESLIKVILALQVFFFSNKQRGSL